MLTRREVEDEIRDLERMYRLHAVYRSNPEPGVFEMLKEWWVKWRRK
jgi:hypothetical protein